jgi:peptidoglycan/xylan/chitin deacetylase (PgdA/CDA1 family)
MSFTEDVEADYENAEAMAEVLQEKGVPGTFFVVSQLVREAPELSQALLAAGEIGSHTADHTPLAGLAVMDQRLRLRRGWSDTRAWAGVAPAGLRPPEERFDTHTLQAWMNAGGSYVMGVNGARSGSPELYHFGGETLVLLPRLLKDDYNVFVQDGAMRTDRLTEALLEGAEKLRSLGGFAAITVHTQIMGTGARLDALRVVADTAQAQGDWWIAQAGDVASWWRQRGAVTLQFTDAGSAGEETAEGTTVPTGGAGQAPVIPQPQGMTLLARAPAREGIQGLWVDILLPEGVGDLKPLVDGIPVSFNTTDFGIRVPVGNLEAGESRRIELRPFPEEEAEAGR